MIRLAAILSTTLLAACVTEEARPAVALEPWMLAHGTTMFAFTPVGFARAYTQDYLEVREIAENESAEDAEAQFLEDLQSDDPGIRLYGMIGLRMIESPEYSAALETMLQDKSYVNVAFGSLSGTSMASEAARDFELYWRSLPGNAGDGD